MFEMLIGKTSNAIDVIDGVGFFGEVPTAGFINGSALASQIGLTAGTAQYSNEPWLHFILDGVELYVAKKPYRYNLTWNQINAVGAALGTRTVVINGKTYKVRLLKSAVGDVYTGSEGYDTVGAHGSEWNRLFYPIHSGKHTNTNNPSPVSGEGIRLGTLTQYNDADLLLHYTLGIGARSWCQESVSTDTGTRVVRGNAGVSHLFWIGASTIHSNSGWRPVLELIQ